MSARNKQVVESVWPGLEAGVPKPLMPYSPAIKAGEWVFIAGTIASDFKTGLDPEVRYANTNLRGELYMQTTVVLRNLCNTMLAAGCEPRRDMVRLWQWLVSPHPTREAFAAGDNWPAMSLEQHIRARDGFLGSPTVPASALGVKELLCFGTRVEVDMICRTDAHTAQLFHAPGDPSGEQLGHAVGLRRGDWVFLAAQDGLEPSGAAPAASWRSCPVEAQADRALAKLAEAATQAGSSLSRAVKADVYIGHPEDFAAMDRVWRRWFPQDPPARVVIPYMGMGRRGARIEVALTLLADDSTLPRKAIEVADAPPGLGHEPQAMKAGDLLFFSTQMAVDPQGRLASGMVRMPEFPWYGSPGKAQMHYMMENIGRICEAANTSVENIARRVCFHSDFQWFAESIEAWASYFPEAKPASTTIRLEDPLVVPGANTLLDLIAYAPD